MPDPATNTIAEGITDQEILNIYKEIDDQAPVDKGDEEEKDIEGEKESEESQSGDQKEDKESESQEQEGEDKPKEKSKEEESATGNKPEEKQEEKPEAEIPEQEINDYAIKHKMTFAEAKADILATKAVLKNYKTPEEIARALRSTQSEYGKLKAQVEKKPAEPAVFTPMSDEQFLAKCTEHLNKEADKHIDTFRQRFPRKSEMMTDEAIIEEIANSELFRYRSWAEQKAGEIKEKAVARKEELLASIPDEDKRWLPDVKAILDKTDTRALMSEGFEIEDLLRHARGEKSRYKADIEAAYQRGFKKAQEQATILGEKPSGGGNNKPRVPGSTSSVGWAGTQEQKERAKEMFPHEPDEKAYEEFKLTFKDELKKNPRFIY